MKMFPPIVLNSAQAKAPFPVPVAPLKEIAAVRPLAAAWIVLLLSVAAACAGTFSANFNDGLVPPGSSVFGDGFVHTTGGTANSGVLKVTRFINSQQGSYIVEDLDGGAGVNSFTVMCNLRIGGGTAPPADGVSFCWAADLPNGTWGE